MARTVVNVLGNSLAAIVMSKWEGRFDTKKGKQYITSLQKAA
jgi:proton glutamate symport protein